MAIVFVATPLAFLVFAWTVGSALDGFAAPLVMIDDEAEIRIRGEFGHWVGEDIHIRQCALAVMGMVSAPVSTLFSLGTSLT